VLWAGAGHAAAAQLPSLPPVELVRRAVHNELQAGESSPYLFRSRKQTPNGSQTRLYAQTREAVAGMTIAWNDKPLTPEQRQAEVARLQRFIADPEELRKKQRQEKENSDRVNRILKALPDAFLYEYDGTEPGRPGVGRAGREVVRLKFRPNPQYDPPSRVEQVLPGMQGLMLIDAKHERLALIDGTLFKDVGFGWGLLGHLDRGGRVVLEQAPVGNGDWRITRTRLHLTGKVLLFKNIKVDFTEVFTDFQRVADDLTFAQGMDLLKKQERLLAETLKQQGNP
jgi:hypothetical protein